MPLIFLHCTPTPLLLSRDATCDFISYMCCDVMRCEQIAGGLGKERTLKYLKEPFIALLRDRAQPVQEALLEHLDATLQLFQAPQEDVKVCLFVSSWRLRHPIAPSLDCQHNTGGSVQ